MRVKFTAHAKFKLQLYGLSEESVKDALLTADTVRDTRFGRKMVIKLLDDHVIVIVYEELDESLKVITVYPTRKRRIIKWLR